MSGRSIGVVVVRYRGGEEVARCLASVLEHGGERLAGAVLVDSGSADGGGEELARRFPTVRTVLLEENRSFAAAAARGVAAVPGELLLLLNPDAELTAGAVETLAGWLDHHPSSPGAVPLLLGEDGRPQHRWQLRRLPRPVDLALGRPGRPAFARPPAAPAPVEQPAAACWLVRRRVWDELGGLDLRYAPAWWEEVAFCARLHTEGAGPFTVLPAATVLHRGGVSAAALGERAFLTAYHANLARFVLRHHPRRAPLLLTALRASLLTRALLRPHHATAYRAAARAVTGVSERNAGLSRG